MTTKARLLAMAAVAILTTPALAQGEATDPPSAGTLTPEVDQAELPTEERGVTADLRLEALKPVLDDAGQAVLDASGEPVEEFQPVLESTALLPGDEIRYVLTLTNEGEDAGSLALALDLPAEALLLPETVTASVGAELELGSSADPELRLPLFVEVDGAEVPNPDWAAAPQSFDLLHATLERLAADETATVTYDLVVR